jgi:tetratricopeptide (TPR) repeat protein
MSNNNQINLEAIVFIHIPKTAGTSFRIAANHQFGTQVIIQDYGNKSPETSKIVFDTVYANKEDLLLSELVNNKIEFFTGHFPVNKYLNLLGTKVRWCTFLREPIQRVISEYNHFVKHRNYDKSLEEFCKVPRNYNLQSRLLAGLQLEDLYFVGITELYEGSLELFNQISGLKLPCLQLNKNRETLNDKYNIDSSVLEIIKSNNLQDLELYNRAKNLLQSRLSQKVLVDLGAVKETEVLPQITDKKLANKLLEEGIELKKIGRRQEAIKKYEAVLQAEPKFAPALSELAATYENNNDLDRALIYYQKLAKIKPKSSTIQLKLAKILVEQEKIEEAIAVYQKAIEIKPKQPVSIYLNLGDALIERERLEEAQIAYEKAIELKPNLSPALTYQKLGNAWQKQEKFDEAIASYEQAARLKPDKYNFYLTLAQLYFKKGDIDNTIASYQKALKLKPDLPFSVYQSLAKMLESQNRPTEAKIWLESAPKIDRSEGATYSEIWQKLNETSLEYFARESQNYPTQIARQAVEQYFAQTSEYKSIDLNALTQEDRQFLDRVGLSLEYLELNRARLISKEGTIEPAPSNSQQITQNARSLALEGWRTDFQQSMVEDGCIYAICPSTGKVLSSNRSFPINKMAIGCYRFVGNEIFYLMTGATWFEKYCLYFPKTETIVYLQNTHKLKPNKNRINAWKTYAVTHWQKIAKYLVDRSEVKTVACIGFSTNIAHHLWNDLSGMQKLAEAGKLSKIDKFLIFGSEFFGRIDKIFPEITADKIEVIHKSKLGEVIFDNNYFAVRLGHLFVQEKLAERLRQTALNQCSSSLKAEIEQIKKKHFPLLWIPIRVGNRTWVDRVEGIANIIKNLADKFSNLGVIFNGVSRLDLRENASIDPQEAEIIEKETEIVKQIQALLPTNIPTFNTVGCSNYESIIWSDAVDLYISPWGAALAKIVWIANKPGIVHTNRSILRLPLAKRTYSFDRENGIVPIYIPASHITDVLEGVAKRNLSDKRTQLQVDKRVQLSNYQCDWRIIYEEALKLALSLNKK